MPIRGSSALFERERDGNSVGEVQARLTVDQTVSAVPMPVTKAGYVVSSRVEIVKVIIFTVEGHACIEAGGRPCGPLNRLLSPLMGGYAWLLV